MDDDATTPETPPWPAWPPGPEPSPSGQFPSGQFQAGQPVFGPGGYPSPPGIAPVPEARSRRRRWIAGAAAIVIVAVSAAGGAALEVSLHHNSSASTAAPRVVTPSSPNSGNGNSGSGFVDPFNDGSGDSSSGTSSSGTTSLDVQSIAAKIDPGIVNIATNLEDGGEAAGTGIVLTSSGEVLTNNHVIDGATRVRVEVGITGKTYTADVVGYDVLDDVAIIQLRNASNMKTVTLDPSASVAANDEIVAIGNALGKFGTPSAVDGVVTATHQTITAGDDSSNTETLTDMIQVQASIQPGDSGGPLVNSHGKVIGMNTAADAGSGRFRYRAGNAGFAIPIAKALNVAHQIETRTTSDRVHIGGSRALLGVLLDNSTTSNAFGDGSSSNSGNGATVSNVESNSAADHAGVKAGDVITGLDSKTVTSPSELRAALNTHQAGDTVSIAWQDSSGATHRASTKLGSGPPA